MKKPNPIMYATHEEYEYEMEKYEEHLRHVEWSRNGAQRAFTTLIIVLGSLIGLCLLGAYLVKYLY